MRTLLSAPLVAAPLTAAVLGMPLHGMLTGLLFQLLWLRDNDSPERFKPDAGYAATVASAISASLVGPLSVGERLLTLWPYGIVVGLLLSPLGGFSRWCVARLLARNLSEFDQAALRGDRAGILRFIGFGIALHALFGAVVTGGGYLLGYAGWKLFQSVWYEADPAMLTIIPLLAGIGIASAARLFLHRDSVFAFIIGAVLVTVLELVRRGRWL